MHARTLALFGPLLVAVAAMLWATDAPFRTYLTVELSSSFIVLAEHGVNLLIALPLLFVGWRELLRLTAREWVAVLAIAIGGSALASIAFTQAFHYVNPSVAILLQKVQPFIAIALAAVLLKERLYKNFWIWALIAALGAYLISFPQLTPQVYEGEAFNPNAIGVMLALFAALLWGASTVFGKYVLRTTRFQTLTALRFGIAFFFLFAFALSHGAIPPLSSVTSTDWLFIAVVALVSGAFSLGLYYYGLQYTKASIATLAELGFPLAAVFVNALFIEGIARQGTYLGLYVGQWTGTLLLLGALYMLSRVNRDELVGEAV